ncbi:MAG: DUF429 domain-containing protein, partial [Desulfobacterales bacterium]|nr:DUF429 domain-containing protein [Desulfobacterales bacterium]
RDSWVTGWRVKLLRDLRGHSFWDVAGIDVGGEVKGFHAVALRGEIFMDKTTTTNPSGIVNWCLDHSATVVSVDAPCGWSQTGSSRQAERELELLGKKIYCFATPTRECSENYDKGFYDVVPACRAE